MRVCRRQQNELHSSETAEDVLRMCGCSGDVDEDTPDYAGINALQWI